MKKEEKKRFVLIDPVTGKIISDPVRAMEDLQKKISEAALGSDGQLKASYEPGPKLNKDSKTLFFSEITNLLWEHKSFMDKEGFMAEVQSDIDEKLGRTNKRIIAIIRDLGIQHQNNSKTLFKSKRINSTLDKLQAEIRTEMEKCLKAPLNRMKVDDGYGKDLLNTVVCMNPCSNSWRKRENELIKKISIIYDKYTPFKKNIVQKSHNLALIFNACGISSMGEEALRKRITGIRSAQKAHQ